MKRFAFFLIGFLPFSVGARHADHQPATSVLGQTNMIDNDSEAATDATLIIPARAHYHAASGYLLVVDADNHRVLIFHDPTEVINKPNASIALGQADFRNRSVSSLDDGRLGRSVIAEPTQEGLFVACYYDNRVLRFETLLANFTVTSLQKHFYEFFGEGEEINHGDAEGERCLS